MQPLNDPNLMEKQKTLEKSAYLSGIALHTGARATLRVLPAEINQGVVFRRIDLPGRPEVRALASAVVDVRRGTTIADGKAVVYTIEHIMSALHACGVDNATIEMDGMEPPIADGSALPFFEMIAEAGVVEQDAEAKFFTPSEILYVDGGATKLVMTPSDKLEISCVTSFAGCPFDPQFFALEVNKESYRAELAAARTFVQYNDLKQLLAMGLVKGGSLDAAAIIHEGAIICKEELRFPNEIVRHKIMDIVGDVYLCGRRVKANIIAIKPGHPKNVELAGMMQKLITQSGN
jgi:UDP-3-O-acyl N-acetylglucosamine deacetylase